MEVNISDKQDELKIWIDKIGLKQKHFAQIYAEGLYNDPTEDDIRIFYEKFRGHMKRSTTKVSTIDIYLNFLFELDEFKNTSYVKPKFHFEDKFSKTFNDRMQKISEDMDI